MTDAIDQIAARNRRQLGGEVAADKCRYCGTSPLHDRGICPRIRAIDYDEGGDVRRVELWSFYEIAVQKAQSERARLRIPIEAIVASSEPEARERRR